MERRVLLLGLMGGSLGLWLGYGSAAQVASKQLVTTTTTPTKAKPRIIKIRLRKFEFEPNHISIRQGESVMFELTSVDFVHGFSIPDLDLRTDVPPGQTISLPLQAQQPGDFLFLCDNFCGEGHEKMQGKLTVRAM